MFKNMRKSIFLENYKGYNLHKIDENGPCPGGIAWGDNGGWLACVFDTIETAKYFIDTKHKDNDNSLKKEKRLTLYTEDFYDLICKCRDKAIVLNNGYVSMEIVNEFEIKK